MKNRYTGAIIIVMLLSLFVLFKGQPLFSVTNSFTVGSLDYIDSYEPVLGVSKYWLALVSVNGGGQEIVGSVSTDQLKKGNTQAQYPLTIRAYNMQDYAQYAVYNTAQEISKYEVTWMQFYSIYSEIKLCNANIVSAWDGKSYPLFKTLSYTEQGSIRVSDRFCIYKYPIAVKGNVEHTRSIYEGYLELTSNYRVLTEVISSDKKSVILRDTKNRAVAREFGSYSPNVAPSVTNIVALAPVNSKNWQFANSAEYAKYSDQLIAADQKISQVEGALLDRTGLSYKSGSEINTILSSAASLLNAASDSVLAKYVFIGDSRTWTSGGTSDFTRSDLKVLTGYPLLLPQFAIVVDAEWLGTRTLVGKPKIISVSSLEFGSGETGNIKVVVKNTGEADGSFYALLNSIKFSQISTVGNVLVKKDDTATITIQISGGTASADVKEVASVSVLDFNDPSNLDTTLVTLVMTPAKVCVPNEYSTDGKNIFKCSSDGLSKVLIDTCSLGTTYVNGKYICSPLGSSPLPTTTLPPITTTSPPGLSSLHINSTSGVEFKGENKWQGSIVASEAYEEGFESGLLNLALGARDTFTKVRDEVTFVSHTSTTDSDRVVYRALNSISVTADKPFYVYLDDELVKSNAREYSYTTFSNRPIVALTIVVVLVLAFFIYRVNKK